MPFSPETDEKIFVVIVLIAIVLLGLWLVIYANKRLRLSNEVKKWPSVAGVITESAVREDFARGGPLGPNYRPRIVYSYNINGIDHKSSCISIFDVSFS